jgi:hypothetical protein
MALLRIVLPVMALRRVAIAARPAIVVQQDNCNAASRCFRKLAAPARPLSGDRTALTAAPPSRRASAAAGAAADCSLELRNDHDSPPATAAVNRQLVREVSIAGTV